MKKRELVERVTLLRYLMLRLLKLLNPVLMTAFFAYAWYSFYSRGIVSPYFFKGNLLIVCLYCALYIVFGRIYDAYTVSYNSPAGMVGNQMLAILVSDSIMYVILWLLTKQLPALLPLALMLAAQFVWAVCWAYGVQWWYFLAFKAKRSVVICRDTQHFEPLVKHSRLSKKFQLVAMIPVQECLVNLEQLRRIQAVFLADIGAHERGVIINYCAAHKISVFLMPTIEDVLLCSAKRMHLFHSPMFRLVPYREKVEYLVIKRIFDISVSVLLLLLLSPLMLITAILVRLDGGPVFYRQHRLTKGGKLFEIFKFRSMRTDAEQDGIARLSTGEHDTRITRVGRVIRKLRIDELPQLVNVLKGEMSLVGPRPERPEIAAQYEEILPEFRLRLQVKAGVTGYAQIFGKYNTSPQDKLKMDLMYIAESGIAQDLRILFATLKVIFVPESTEGVQQGQKTALTPPR